MNRKLIPEIEPREITLQYKQERIHPREVFELLYSGLDSLIDAVVDSFTSHGRKEKMEARCRCGFRYVMVYEKASLYACGRC